MKNCTTLLKSKKYKYFLLTAFFVLAVPLVKAQTVAGIITNSDDHAKFGHAILEAGLDATLDGEGPFTVFAPTDEAIDALPPGVWDYLLMNPEGALTDVLLYHVAEIEALSENLSDGDNITTMLGEYVSVTITGEDIYINNAKIVVADIQADNGVVHAIDAALVPPTTVLGIIKGSDDHETLEEAINTAGLEDDLKGDGPFTIFAPTDAAFDALPEGILDALMNDPEGALTDLVLYHAFEGEILFDELYDGQMITTMLSQDIEVSVTDDSVFVNDARVIVTDLVADNGVVHVINAVLMPGSPNSINASVSNFNNLNVHPNPARNYFNINVTLEKPQTTLLEIYTISGRKIIERDLGTMPAGKQSITEPVNNLTNGMYFIVIGSSSDKKVTNVQVIR